MPNQLEKVAEAGVNVELASTAEARRLNALYKQCGQLAKSDLVPKALKGKADNVFALALYGEQFGLTPIHAVQRIYIIEGTFEPKAEVLAGVVMRAGHEIRWDETSSDRCTVSIRRNGSNDWQSTTWTLDDARRAGLLDMWVERRVPDGNWPDGGTKYKVDRHVVGDDNGVFTADERARRALGPIPEWAQQQLDAGDVKRKDPWFQFPGDMLAAKALRRATKRIVGDVLLGLHDDADPFEPLTPERVLATTAEAPSDEDDHEPDDAAADDVADQGDPSIEDADIVPTDDKPADDSGDDRDAAHASAIKRLMVTCGKAFPETDAPRGEKTRRQRLLRRASQYAVIGEHRSANDLTVDELEAVETWIYRRFIDTGTTTPMTYEIVDGDVVRFTLGGNSKDVPPADGTPAAA